MAGSQGGPATAGSRLAAIHTIVRTPPLSARKARLAHSLTSVAALALGLVMAAAPARGQTVTATGDVDPAGAAGPVWNIPGTLRVGNTGDGTLAIEVGGKVENADGYIGYEPGSTGAVTVSGVDAVSGDASVWANSGDLYVGRRGAGSLSVAAGGRVEDVNGYIGLSRDSTGEVTVSGNGSIWASSKDLYVGNLGRGTLTIKDHSTVTSQTGHIGYESLSTGAVTVSGDGSVWKAADTLNVGYKGSGTLTISDGGRVEDRYGWVGAESQGASEASAKPLSMARVRSGAILYSSG